MRRIVGIALYVGLLVAMGGLLADKHGYLDGFRGPTSDAKEIVAPAQVPHYHAVLAAGDASITNFDNAVEVLGKRLERSNAATRLLTSDGALVNDWRWYATSWTIDEALSSVGEDDAYLIFVTSHGNEYGLVMGMDNAEQYYLTPARLAEILARDCGERPTV